MRRLDHSMIFVFIAGTYTPFAVLLLPHTTAIVILSIVWGGAILGVGTMLITPNAPRWLSAPIYVALGWVAIFVLPEIARGGGTAALVLLLAGGMFYTVGAVLYALAAKHVAEDVRPPRVLPCLHGARCAVPPGRALRCAVPIAPTIRRRSRQLGARQRCDWSPGLASGDRDRGDRTIDEER